MGLDTAWPCKLVFRLQRVTCMHFTVKNWFECTRNDTLVKRITFNRNYFFHINSGNLLTFNIKIHGFSNFLPNIVSQTYILIISARHHTNMDDLALIQLPFWKIHFPTSKILAYTYWVSYLLGKWHHLSYHKHMAICIEFIRYSVLTPTYTRT